MDIKAISFKQFLKNKDDLYKNINVVAKRARQIIDFRYDKVLALQNIEDTEQLEDVIDEDFDKDSWETQTKMSLFQTGTSKKVGVGYMQQSANVDTWLTENGEWASKYPHATSFLVPYEVGLEYNEDMAWGWKQRQIAKGLRELKSRDEYIKDFYFNGAASEYYDRKQRSAYAVAVLQSQNQFEAAKEIDERWKIWDKGFMERHPVFFVETQKGRSANRRQATFEEFKAIIRNPELVPDTPNKNEILDSTNTPITLFMNT